MYSFPLSRRACFLWERRGLVVVGLRDATLCQGKGKGRCVRDSRHNVTTHTGFISHHSRRTCGEMRFRYYLDCVGLRRVHAELPVDIVDCKQLSSTFKRTDMQRQTQHFMSSSDRLYTFYRYSMSLYIIYSLENIQNRFQWFWVLITLPFGFFVWSIL